MGSRGRSSSAFSIISVHELEETRRRDPRTFHRHFIPYQSLPDWHKSKKQLTELHINAKGTIEDDGFGMLQVDFANALVGGGVLGHGCVQEEIRFLISPELILSRLFTERLSGNECLVVTGFERFSKYSGYASSFKFDGAYHDDTPIDKGSKHRKTRMVAIDALPPGHSSSQYSPQNVQRELNKAFVGFKNYNPSVKNPVAVATGNWGCGAFGGDPQLKGLLQIMAASEARRDVAYFTFSNRKLRDQIHEMHTLLKSRKLTVGQICSMICQYHIHCTEESSLYEFIQNQLNCCFGTNRKVPAKGKKTPKKATPQTDKITGVCTGNKTTQAEATTSALTSPTNKSTKVEPTEDPLPRAKSNKEIITGCCISIEGNPKQENVQDNTESLAKADVRKEAMDVDEADIIPLGDSVDSSGTRDEDLKRDR
ncbi:poly(ADP-ribose) glycohydrolase-like [Tigriopus californicus]|nr:poly(ADP-ribose) glycohydrolase-like [Tigriopus californicus]